MKTLDIIKYNVNRAYSKLRSPRSIPWENDLCTQFFATRYHEHTEKYTELFNENLELRTEVRDTLYNKINKTKTPGAPLCYMMTTNAGLENIKAEFFDIVTSRVIRLERVGEQLFNDMNDDYNAFLKKLDLQPSDDYATRAVRNVEDGLVDVVLMMIKSEPREMKDGVKKPPRLVASVSVVDNSVARVILGDSLLTEQTFPDVPTAVALDITTQSSTARMYEEFVKNAPLISNDIQGYEWTNTSFDHFSAFWKHCVVMKLASSVNGRMVISPGCERHFHALLGLYYVNNTRVLQTCDGELVVPLPGQVSSGYLTTFSDNSCKRAWMAEEFANEVGATNNYIKTAGDDCLEKHDLRDVYMKHGYVITDVQTQTDNFSFCSTEFTKTGSYQVNINKFIYNVICDDSLKKPELVEEQRLAFEQAFSNHPERERALKEISEAKLRYAARSSGGT